MIEYTIQINLESEIIKNQPAYFWCILRQDMAGSPSNCGFGWADSVSTAFYQAYDYYMKYISNTQP